MVYIICQALFSPFHSTFIPRSLRAGRTAAGRLQERVHPSALPFPSGHQLPHGQLHIPLAAPGRSAGYEPLPWGKRARRLLSPSLAAISSHMGLHIPLAAPGRPGDYQPPPGGRWAPSAALPFPGCHLAPQGCSEPARRLPASPMGKMYHRLLFPPLVASQLPRAAPGRPGGCQPPPGGRGHRRLLSPLLVATSFSGQLCFSSLATLGCLL